MKEFREIVELKQYSSKLFNTYFKDKNFAVFDIEATGLSPAFCKVILTGILLWNAEKKNFEAIQYFADGPDDEAELISKTAEILNTVDFVVTYNGRHYDMPFMQHRAEKNNVYFPDDIYDLDLYQVVNGYSAIKEVTHSLKQKSIEVYLGLSDGRDDEISGKESVELYNRYMETHSFELERKILLHNHDDIIQLYKILNVISECEFDKAMFKLGFPAGNFNIKKIMVKNKELAIEAIQRGNAMDYISFPGLDTPFSVNMSKLDKACSVSISTDSAAGADYLDCLEILGDESTKSLEKFPGFSDGYLIIRNGKEINYLELNSFVKALFESSCIPHMDKL